MRLTLEHLPAAIGKVQVVGAIMEGQLAHNGQRLVTDLKTTMEA